MTEISKLSVLIIDDDPFLLKFIGRLLDQHAITDVDTATDGRVGLDAIKTRMPDVVISDLNMPQMDGVELMRHMAAFDDPPKIILMSGVDKTILETAELLAVAHRLPLLGCLTKPIKPKELEACLNRATAAAVRRGPQLIEELTEEELTAGLASGALFAMYQPKVELGSGRVIGFEALARWRNPAGDVIGPAAFIPLAENNGQIDAITKQVCDIVIKQAARWHRNGLDCKISVNVSVDNLTDLNFVSFITDKLAEHALPPRFLMIEVTESRLLQDIVKPLEVLTRLRMKGIELAIDDFGTGSATLEQLRRIPCTELKIDRTFVKGAAGNQETHAILSATQQMADSLGLYVVAEGAEEEDWETLRAMGCQAVQSYSVARPMPVDEVEDWMVAWRQDHPSAFGPNSPAV